MAPELDVKERSNDIRQRVGGVILSGGKASRMGGLDKGLIDYHGKPLIKHVLDTLATTLDTIVISANRNVEHYRAFGYPIIEDSDDTYRGPLEGIRNGLARLNTGLAFIAPCDVPALDAEVLPQLLQAMDRESSEIAVAEVNGVIEPVIMVINSSLGADIAEFLQHGGRKTSDWIQTRDITKVDFSDHPEWFFNVNAPQDAGLNE